MRRPKISIITLGGTISMKPGPGGGIVPALSADELVETVPGLAEVGEIETRSPLQLPSPSLTLEHLDLVANEIRSAAARGSDGVVIVQGTDTIEETAFLLDHLELGEIAVVVTGAMRGATAAGADGPANLLASAQVAAASAARDLGVLVVMEDTVHAARFVRKGNTGLVSSFTSSPFGPVGFVIEGEFSPRMRPVRHGTRYFQLRFPAPRVSLVPSGLGDDGLLLESLPGVLDGAVIVGMGAGHMPEAALQRIDMLVEAMPVVLASRVSDGPVFRNTYGFPGSERDLIARGLIPSGWLGATRSRLLLILALMTGEGREGVARTFSEHM